MQKLIVANWKLNPANETQALALASAEDVEGLVIAPPVIFLDAVRQILKHATLGAQDVFWKESGAYTGEISPTELAAAGVKVVLVGHSERRRYAGETDEIIAEKMRAAIDASLIPILCVGENAEERGRERTKTVLEQQLHVGLSKIIGESSEKFGIAYEPLWAIGSGKPDTAVDTAESASFITHSLRSMGFLRSPKILYGGSVTAENAGAFLNEKSVGGLLVGGASLRPKEMVAIAYIAAGKMLVAERGHRVSPPSPAVIRSNARKNLFILGSSIAVGIAFAVFGFVSFAIQTIPGFAVFGAIVAGILFTSIYTVGPGAVVLAGLMSRTELLPIALWGALGAMIGDAFLVQRIHERFKEEIADLFHHAHIHRLRHFVDQPLFRSLAPIFGALIVLSPAPDQTGLALMTMRFKHWQIVLLSLALNLLGILAIGIAARIF